MFEGFSRTVMRAEGSLSYLRTWCRDVGLNLQQSMLLTDLREKVIAEGIVAGINPFWGATYRLADATADTFSDIVVRLKYCIFAGLKQNMLTYEPESNKYSTRRNTKVSVPAAYSDNSNKLLHTLGKLLEVPKKPYRLVSNSVSLRITPKSPSVPSPPLLYTPTAGLTSILDNYVQEDPSFWLPRQIQEYQDNKIDKAPNTAPNTSPQYELSEKSKKTPLDTVRAYLRIVSVRGLSET
jgi:hypothetical protein